MRTTVSISDSTISKLVRLTGRKSRTAAIRYAVEQFVEDSASERLLAARGRFQLDRVEDVAAEAERVERAELAEQLQRSR